MPSSPWDQAKIPFPSSTETTTSNAVNTSKQRIWDCRVDSCSNCISVFRFQSVFCQLHIPSGNGLSIAHIQLATLTKQLTLLGMQQPRSSKRLLVCKSQHWNSSNLTVKSTQDFLQCTWISRAMPSVTVCRWYCYVSISRQCRWVGRCWRTIWIV